ncbi:MAG: Do family serine endopeptidase [Coxiellaceae bacterium]|nr:Do family serine endopeptidase [Coxiellaceae bacterium]
MKKLLLAVSLLIACLAPITSEAHAAVENNSLAPILKKVMPAIVNISVEKVTMTDLNKLIPTQDTETKIPVKSFGVGSGVIFEATKGLIITNAHVIDNQKVIIVTLKDGERYHAKLLAKDMDYDIAILQIQANHLTALPFANSDDVAVGDFVTAIGSPYGLSQTVTSGVVSAVNRSHPQIEGYQNFIQTDAPINPGNSGGALVDMKGELVGINTAIIGPNDGNIGIGFAIPSNMVRAVIDQLLKYGKVERSMLGVIVQNITPELADALHIEKEHGALVSQVMPGTPAAIAGLQTQDVIVKIDDHDIHNATQLRNLIGLIRPNTSVHITYVRNKISKMVTAVVIDPKTATPKTKPYLSGMRLQEMTELEKDGTNIHGLLVTEVSDESAGALAGLTPGDVITTANGKSVTSISALETTLQNQKAPVVLNVLHNSRENIFLVLEAN